MCPRLFLNVSIVGRPAGAHDELRGLLNAAASHAATCNDPSAVLLREEWLPAGWEDVGPRTWTSVGWSTMRWERDLAELNALAYGLPANEFDCIANMLLWHADSYAYVEIG